MGRQKIIGSSDASESEASVAAPGPPDAPPKSEDRNLRPRLMDEMVGQADIKEQLRIVVDAAKRRNEALSHLLFDGPPGLGKRLLQRRFPTSWAYRSNLRVVRV